MFPMKRNASRDHNFQVRGQIYEVHLSERNLTAPCMVVVDFAMLQVRVNKSFRSIPKAKTAFYTYILLTKRAVKISLFAFLWTKTKSIFSHDKT